MRFTSLKSLVMETGMEPPVSGVPIVFGLLSESESESKSNLLGSWGCCGRWGGDGDGEVECCT